MDILKLNGQLVSVDLEVDAEVIQGLKAICSHTLKSISLRGNVDCFTILDAKHNFLRLDTIRAFCYEDEDLLPSAVVEYCVSKQRLEVDHRFFLVKDWQEFIAVLPPKLSELHWSGYYFHHLRISDVLGETIQVIEISCREIDEEIIQTILRSCISLKTFVCRSEKAIYWPKALNASNAIEKLAIDRPNDYTAYLLTFCRYLITASFSNCIIDGEVIPCLSTVIKNYRHAITGNPIHCKCTFKFSEDMTTVHDMEYRFGQFSGKVWIDSTSQMEAPSEMPM